MTCRMNRILPSLFVLCASTSFAGIKVVWDRVSAEGKNAEISMQCEGENARFEGMGMGDKKSVAIWDAKKQMLEVVRDENKSYTALDPAQIAAMAQRLAAMRASLAQMPPEKREQLEKMMGGKMADDPKAEWVFTSKNKKSKVAKWDCELYDAKRGAMEAEMCIIPWEKSPLKREDLKCVKPISEMFKGMSSDEADGMTDMLEKFPGMPALSVRNLADGKKSTTTMKSADHAAVAASAFEIPAGYKETSMKHPPPPAAADPRSAPANVDPSAKP